MTTKVKKWGNSLGIRIPKGQLESFNISENTEVIIEKTKNGILIRPSKNKDETLEELLSKINPENIHKEIDWGNSVGKEIW